MIEFAEVQKLAVKFLETADALNEKVSAYIDGSHNASDFAAYDKVKAANAEFLKAYSSYTGEPLRNSELNYELAEACIPEEYWEE